jgi:hypothetical protein
LLFCLIIYYEKNLKKVYNQLLEQIPVYYEKTANHICVKNISYLHLYRGFVDPAL